MRFAFVEEHRDQLPVTRLCKIMDVSARGYRAWRSRILSRSQRQDMVVLAHIREQFRLSLGSYGRPRMTEELKALGLDVGHRRVGRLMRENAIAAKRSRKHKDNVQILSHIFLGLVVPDPSGLTLRNRQALEGSESHHGRG